jgi:hypothetical protein
MAIWYILWQFGIPTLWLFWYVVARKIWQPCSSRGPPLNAADLRMNFRSKSFQTSAVPFAGFELECHAININRWRRCRETAVCTKSITWASCCKGRKKARREKGEHAEPRISELQNAEKNYQNVSFTRPPQG